MSRQLRALASRADVNDIDGWWRRVVEHIVALVAAAWRVIRDLTRQYLTEHAAIEGRDVDPELVEWNTEQVLTALRVTGPVAFKIAVRDGKTASEARQVMAERLTGAGERLVLNAGRDTVAETVNANREIVGWRRVSDGDPCAFCAMLVSRGAVYKSARTAGDPRFGGTQYHDHDGCWAEALYEREEEPAEVDDLYRQWLEVTAGRSGQDAIRAWRRYWDGRTAHTDEPREADREPTTVEVPDQAKPFHRDLVGVEDLAAFAADVDRLESSGGTVDFTALSGGNVAETHLATLPDGRTAVFKQGAEWGLVEQFTARHQTDAEQLASKVAAALGVPAPGVYRENAEALWMRYIPGAKSLAQLQAEAAEDSVTAVNELEARYEQLLDSRQGKLLGLLDLLLINNDRHPGNVLITDDGRLIAIDHGIAWAESSVDRHPEPGHVRWWGDRPANHYIRPGRLGRTEWVEDNPLTPQDITQVRRRLELLRPDFELLGRADWLRYMLQLLDMLEPFAKGEEPIIA